MVQIHAFEHLGLELRVTDDIDVLGDARRPGTLARINRGLIAAGFVLTQLSPDGVAYRFTRDDLIVDLLAPDGLREPASLDGAIATVSVSGGSQALARSATIDVQVGDKVFAIQRPTLLGAILIKARAIRTHSDPDTQRADLALAAQSRRRSARAGGGDEQQREALAARSRAAAAIRRARAARRGRVRGAARAGADDPRSIRRLWDT